MRVENVLQKPSTNFSNQKVFDNGLSSACNKTSRYQLCNCKRGTQSSRGGTGSRHSAKEIIFIFEFMSNEEVY
jgi:hypothetical protein